MVSRHLYETELTLSLAGIGPDIEVPALIKYKYVPGDRTLTPTPYLSEPPQDPCIEDVTVWVWIEGKWVELDGRQGDMLASRLWCDAQGELIEHAEGERSG